MSFKKTGWWIFFYILVSILFRTAWVVWHLDSPHAPVENGILDLQQTESLPTDTFSLKGDWLFYDNKFISSDFLSAPDFKIEHAVNIPVPGSWEKEDRKKESQIGSGTYRVKILLPSSEKKTYGILFSNIITSADFFINGEKEYSFNSTSTGSAALPQKRGEHFFFFESEGPAVDLVIYVSNQENPFFGGLTGTLKFGEFQNILKERNLSLFLQGLIIAIYSLHFLYVLVIYLAQKKPRNKNLLYFGLVLISSIFSMLIDDTVIAQIPVSYGTAQKILFIFFSTTLIGIILFVGSTFHFPKKRLTFFKKMYFLNVFLLMIVPYTSFFSVVPFLALYFLSAYIYMVKISFQLIKQGFINAIFILFYLTSFILNSIWGVLIQLKLFETPYYPLDFLLSLLMISFLLIKGYRDLTILSNEQTVALKEADKEKDLFLATVAHELRNPLQGILNLSRHLFDEYEVALGYEGKEQVSLLMMIGKRMNILVEDLLDFQRLSTKKLQLKLKPVDLHILIPTVVEVIRSSHRNPALFYSFDFPEEYPLFEADENRIIQVLYNLIHNAAKYTKEGDVNITVSYTNEKVIVSVSDRGPGIEPKKLKDVLEPYVQLEPDPVFREGMGIGLNVSKQLIELHGGTLQIDSVLGQGTTAWFELPLKKKETSFHQKKDKDPLPVLSKINEDPVIAEEQKKLGKILLVEDDFGNLSVIKTLLSKEHEVVGLTQPKDALPLLLEQEFDLVITDLMMPGLSGYELTKEIRKMYSSSELPILLLTARNRTMDLQLCFQAGANDYLIKPADTYELKARVHSLIATKQSAETLLEMEGAWLQAQINPHFIHNTLNSIVSLHEIDSKRMLRLIDEFANYLRQSFRTYHTAEVIPFSKEWDSIKSYLYIQKERFGNRLHIETSLPENITVQLPPFSLQPIIENAITHGILKKMAGGTIVIHAIMTDDHVLFEISDDGVGMTEEKISSILNREHSSTQGIGLYNTHRRLLKLYGQGLSIQSTPDKGTTISFIIPKQ